jgi:hypothetical protein
MKDTIKILFLSATAFICATVVADQEVIEIDSTSSATLSGSGMMDCCSLVNITTNPSEISTKNCNVQGGYCMGGKRFGAWAYDTSSIPEDATIISASFNGVKSGASGWGHLNFMNSYTGTISTATGGQLFSNSLTQNINWPSNAAFSITLSTSARNLLQNEQFIMVGAYQASTSSMVINNYTNAPRLSLVIEIPEQACEADFNADGHVNVSDMLQLIGSWGACWNKSCDADLNGDNQVSVSDLLLLIDAWGTCS